MVETLLEWADALVSKKWEWVIPLWLLWLLQHLQCQQNICYQNNHYQFTLHPFGPKVFYSKDMDFDPRYLRTWVLKYMLKLLFMMANWPFNNNFLFEFRWNRVAQIVADWLRENGKRMRKWRGNGERMRNGEEIWKEWGNGERFSLYISSYSRYFFSLYPFPLSKISHFVAKC